MALLDEARSALAAEWASTNPATPEEISTFYRKAHGIAADLDAWHQTEPRRKWTEAIAYVAQKIEAGLAVDIGCGGGQDLIALREAGIPRLYGVEPNEQLAQRVRDAGIVVGPDVEHAPVEDADLLICIDVLEHVVNPEAFLACIANRARVGGDKPGAVLVETTATFDMGTPLHLEANRGWHPGRVLERHGFTLIDQSDRFRVWQRVRAKGLDRTTLMLMAYRAVSVQTFNAILELSGVSSELYVQDRTTPPPPKAAIEAERRWRVMTKSEDALVSRARSVVASRWWAERSDNVFLMVDDDIVFTHEDAEKIVAETLKTDAIVCGAYPIRSGAHLAIRGGGDAEGAVKFGPDEPLLEIEYASTGFMAVHRKVLDAIIPTLELCHADRWYSFWPLFMPFVRPMGPAKAYLSEDWAFCARAREAGFKVWLDPSIRLGHLAQVQLDVDNMSRIAAAVGVKSA